MLTLIKWQGRQGSDLRPTVLETVALPAELLPYAKLILMYLFKNKKQINVFEV